MVSQKKFTTSGNLLMTDVIIVLGNYLCDDGSLSLINRERCFHALELLKTRNSALLLLSGGKANTLAPQSEAEAMRQYFLLNGVSDDIIITESQSKNTFENVKFCMEIIKKIDFSELFLVSSSYHINRWYFNPIRFFKKYHDIKVAPVACFDSNVIRLTPFEKERQTTLVIFSKNKQLSQITKRFDGNLFALKIKTKQKDNKKTTLFLGTEDQLNSVTNHIKKLYGIEKLDTQRI